MVKLEHTGNHDSATQAPSIANNEGGSVQLGSSFQGSHDMRLTSAAHSGVQEYRELIEELATGRINQRISNGFPTHASILIEAMFKFARSEVRIFSGSLAEDVFGARTLVIEAQRFLAKDPGHRVRILLQHPISGDRLLHHPLIAAVKKIKDAIPFIGSFELNNAVGNYARGEAEHFAVMDKIGFRYEIDHGATKAFANFNEPKTAAGLASAFDAAFEMGSPCLAL